MMTADEVQVQAHLNVSASIGFKNYVYGVAALIASVSVGMAAVFLVVKF